MYSIFTNVYLFDGDKILFLHRSPSKAVWPDALLGVGGKVEPGEDVREAAAREFREEAGAAVTDLKLAGTLSWVDGENQNGINYIFTARKYDGEIFSVCDEGSFEWIDIRDAMVDPRTAIHQLRYLPYLANGEHFSQHMHFKGPFSEGVITKDLNSVTYTNHRLAKSVKATGLATGNSEKLEFVETILAPYEVSVFQDDDGVSVDTNIHVADAALDMLLRNGIKKSVEDTGLAFTPENAVDFYVQKINKPMRVALEYTVQHQGKSLAVLIPAQLTNTPMYDASMRDNFFWSLLQFNVGSEVKYYAAMSIEDKSDTFSLLAQAVMKIG